MSVLFDLKKVPIRTAGKNVVKVTITKCIADTGSFGSVGNASEFITGSMKLADGGFSAFSSD